MQTDLNISNAMAWIIRTEGGYSNDLVDRGGETNFGISRKSYPDIDIRGLTVEEAQEIYRVDYWDANRCGELPGPVGLAFFDALVNHQPRTATRILQRAVGATQDGIVGPQTIRMANYANPLQVVRAMALSRLDLYDGLVRVDPTQGRFIAGWRGRVLDLLNFLHTHYTLEQHYA